MSTTRLRNFFLVGLVVIFTSQLGLRAQSGSVDPEFGFGAPVFTNVPGATAMSLQGTKVQSDGKIVSLHHFSYSDNIRRLALTRKLANGSTDTSFGDGGHAYSQYPATGLLNNNALSIQIVNGEERFVIAGRVPAGKNSWMSRFERYDNDGNLDTSFGTNGVTTVNLNYVVAMTVLSGGKILAISIGGTLLRLDEYGRPDASFGSNGLRTPAVKINPIALLELPSGRIVAAGSSQGGGVSQFTVSRYNADGTSDDGGRGDSSAGDSFGMKGKTIVSFPGKSSGAEAYDVKLDSSGKLVVSGVAGWWAEGDMAVARMSQGGILDTTFAGTGKTFFPHPGGGTPAYNIGFQSDGKIVLIGYLWRNLKVEIAAIRYQTNGALDTEFGQGGMTMTDILERDDYGFHGFVRIVPNCSVLPCERILISGYSQLGPSGGLVIPVMLQYVP